MHYHHNNFDTYRTLYPLKQIAHGQSNHFLQEFQESLCTSELSPLFQNFLKFVYLQMLVCPPLLNLNHQITSR